MRKLIWCCAALALLAAAAVYAAAEYADRCPDSLFGRCVLTFYRAGTVYAPLGEVTREAVGRSFEVVQKVTEHPEVVPTTVTVIPPDPVPAPAAEPTCPAACPAHDSGEECPRAPAMLGKVIIQPDDDAAGDRAQPAPTGGGAEEAEFVPPPMPHAREDEAVPPKMPYATDNTPAEERDVEGVDFWWKLFQEAATDCTDGAEEKAAPPAVKTPDCREDPQYDEQYPGCPALGPCPRGGCPHAGKCPAARHDEPAVEDKGEPPANADGADEQSEPPAAKPAEPKTGPDAKAPEHGSIDTTEYRPSDGNPFDYSSHPY